MKEILIELYSPEFAERWDRFVKDESRNGTIFQERRFLAYHPAERFEDDSLVFVTDGIIVGVFPAAKVKSENGYRAVSHPGSSAGGIVFHRKCGLRDVLFMLEKAIMYYQKTGIASLELRLGEPVFAYPVEGELGFMLWHRGFKLTSREISSCVNLLADQDWFDFGRKNNRTDIRRLVRKGITVELLEEPSTIYPLIYANLGNKYGKHPTHSLPELIDLKQRYPERIHFWAAMHESQPVATIVVFIANQYAVHNFYTAQGSDASKLHIMPLLFDHVFRYYKNCGYLWFNFGISSRGDWIKWGILEFKEQMGGRATIRENWVYDDLSKYIAYEEK